MTQPELCEFIKVFIIDWLLMFVNQTHVGADSKVPFAVTGHICTFLQDVSLMALKSPTMVCFFTLVTHVIIVSAG